MDDSKEYILMCKEADEIQEGYKPTIGDYTIRKCEYDNFRIGLVTKKHIGDLYWITLDGEDGLTLHGEDSQLHFYESLIWLPRQDQLQSIVSNDACVCLIKLLEWYAKYELTYILPKISNSMEQLWLVFIMKEKYGKTWVDNYWK